jgi:ABC-type polysaccharide/polyol phosphate transport system ATPase subunit
MIIVTHDAEFIVKECTRAVWIQDKRVAVEGDPRAVVDAYHEFLHGVGERH